MLRCNGVADKRLRLIRFPAELALCAATSRDRVRATGPSPLRLGRRLGELPLTRIETMSVRHTA